jgi:hypothetical protein
VNTSCWHSQCAAFGRSSVYAALEARASGFLLKSAPSARLVEAVRLVASGEALLAPTLARRLIDEYVRGPGPGSRSTELGALTEREAEVLRLIAHALSNPEIARHLIGQSGHREDARQPDPLQARPPRPRPSRRARLRVRTRSTRRAPAAQDLTRLSTATHPQAATDPRDTADRPAQKSAGHSLRSCFATATSAHSAAADTCRGRRMKVKCG